MNDVELVALIRSLVTRETEVLLELLSHLGDLDRREAYLPLGYSSTFDFCCRGLRYSESAAVRRVRAARCVRDFPRVGELLKSRDVNLTTMYHFTSILTKENEDQVLACVSGKSKDEVKRYVDSLTQKFHTVPPREVIRPVRVLVQKAHSVEPMPLFAAPVEVAVPPPLETMEPEEQFEIRYTVNKEDMAFVRRLQTLRSRSGRVPTVKELFMSGVRESLRREDPRERAARREKRSAKKSPPLAAEAPSISPRRAPRATADKVLNAHDHCCSFTAPDGTKCTNTVGVQIDHIRPFGMGGGHEEENLRTLCSRHNRFAAEQVYGKEFMDRFR